MKETEIALGTHCGITFAGIKAASLFSLKKSCGYCLQRYEEYFDRRGFAFLVLRSDGERSLIYVYNRRQLWDILSDCGNRSFLQEEGYFYSSSEEALEILKSKMKGDSFPHEIGIFLGYPLDDVLGFIAHPNEGVMLMGCWKVYTDVEKKKRLFEVYDKCTRKIRERLLGGATLENIFCKTIGDVTAR